MWDSSFSWRWRLKLLSCRLWCHLVMGRMPAFWRTLSPPSSGWRRYNKVFQNAGILPHHHTAMQPTRPRLKWWVRILRYYCSLYLGWLKIAMRNFNQNSRSLSQDLNWKDHKYKAGVLTVAAWCLIWPKGG